MTDMIAVSSKLDVSSQVVRETVFEMVSVAQELGFSLNFEAIVQPERYADVARLIELSNVLDIIVIPCQTWN